MGNGKPVKLIDFIETLEEISGLNFDKEFLPMQKGDVHSTHADIEITKQNLGWAPTIEIKEGLTEFYNWYKYYYQISVKGLE